MFEINGNLCDENTGMHNYKQFENVIRKVWRLFTETFSDDLMLKL